VKKIIVLAAFILMIGSAYSQKEVFSKSDTAIQGYDAVAYFKNSKAMLGKKEFSYTWKGAAWNFTSKENMNDFKTNPEKFAPQFGGYCAYGVADGHKAPTSPDAWTIVDNKLYLNYNKDVRELWKKNQHGFIKKANENWPDVKKEKD
jgi:YHS domain-containing protein